jgi:hypothetical protein
MGKPISNNEFDNLDAFFSNKLKDASMPPPEKIWQQIEDSLNKDRKRKRGFLWIFFSGLFLIGTTIATYFILFDVKESATSSIAEVKSTSAAAKPTVTNTTTSNNTKNNKESIKQAANVQPINNTESNLKEEKSKMIKIQIGAFRKQKDKTAFNKINLDIKSESIQNGIIRYYAEVSESDVQQALEQIKQAGFRDAFIKEENSNVSTNLIASKNNPTISSEPVSSLKPNKQKTGITIAKQNQSKNNNTIVTTDKVNAGQANKEPVTSSNEANGANDLTTTNQISQNQVSDSGIIRNNTLNPVETNTIAETSSRGNENVVLKDSTQKDTVLKVVASTKNDSLIIKPDSVKKSTPIANADSSNKVPILNRWALILTGGPNFFIKNTKSNLFTTSGEKQPYTYNATLKIEFKPFKRIAFTAGVSYSYFIAQQDATLFYFNRYLTSDYTFYSSFGPMAVDKNTMLQGFSPLAPTTITMFRANYSYTSKINTLLIPVQAKYYYLNTKRINLFADIGISGMMVLSQQTNLSVIKEGVTNNLSYNQITTTKLNGLLMLGLGGDVRLYKQLYFTIDGSFRYNFNNLSSTSGIKNNPTYFSTNAGIKIKL